MAENSVTNRKYNFPDGDLALFANTLSSVMTRDISVLATYGITNLVINDFKDCIDDFQALATDELLRADLSYAVELRESNRNAVMNIMRSISLRAKAVFGENSSKYRAMTPGNISQMPDSNLLPAANQVHTAALGSLTQLAAEGVTTLYLTDFQSAIDAYENAINEVNDKKVARDTGTEAKVLKGNELYALVVKYCDYGKLAWDGISEAKYNDYLIYTGSSPVTMDKPTGLAFDSLTQTFRWNEVENASSYVLQASNDGENFNTVYSGSNLSVVYEPIFLGNNVFRVKARNSSGLSEASDVITVEYYSILPVPDNLNAVLESPNTVNFSFSPVPTADRYLLFRNVVALGAVAGVFNQMGETALNYYIGPIEQGKRTYYKVKAAVDLRESDFSHFVYLDVPITPV